MSLFQLNIQIMHAISGEFIRIYITTLYLKFSHQAMPYTLKTPQKELQATTACIIPHKIT